jgi:hypothetical protein
LPDVALPSQAFDVGDPDLLKDETHYRIIVHHQEIYPWASHEISAMFEAKVILRFIAL